MKHKCRFQFIERFGSRPTWSLIDPLSDDFKLKSTGWSKPMLKFACDCGKTKRVEER